MIKLSFDYDENKWTVLDYDCDYKNYEWMAKPYKNDEIIEMILNYIPGVENE